jgi:hypothetical protein
MKNKLKLLIIIMNNKFIKEHKKIILIISFTLLLALVLIFYLSFTKETEIIDQKDDIITDYEESTIIPVKFLPEETVRNLGLQPGTKAQILKDEPLIYRIIKSDEDIITDVAPLLKPIRENNR